MSVIAITDEANARSSVSYREPQYLLELQGGYARCRGKMMEVAPASFTHSTCVALSSAIAIRSGRTNRNAARTVNSLAGSSVFAGGVWASIMRAMGRLLGSWGMAGSVGWSEQG